MNRGAGLPGGLANLGDSVRVVDLGGHDLGLMIVAEAKKLASELGAELFVSEPKALPPVVRIVEGRKLAALLEAEIGRRNYEQG